MRQGQQNRRGRGRVAASPKIPWRGAYESNGPDVKIRGTAAHIAEKYMSLARDALASGDMSRRRAISSTPSTITASSWRPSRSSARSMAANRARAPMAAVRPSLEPRKVRRRRRRRIRCRRDGGGGRCATCRRQARGGQAERSRPRRQGGGGQDRERHAGDREHHGGGRDRGDAVQWSEGWPRRQRLRSARNRISPTKLPPTR